MPREDEDDAVLDTMSLENGDDDGTIIEEDVSDQDAGDKESPDGLDDASTEETNEEDDELTKVLWPDGRPDEKGNPQKKLPPKKDKTRFEYHQSQSDKWRHESEALREQLRLQEPIIKYVQAHPSVLQNVDSNVSDGSSKGDLTDGNKESPTKPVRPTKPAGYDKVEAATDPNSESAKYHQSLAEYLDEFATYQEAIDDRRVEVERQRQAAFDQEEQRKETISQTYRELITKYHFSEEEARDFIVTMTNPKSRSMENLVQFYKVQKGKVAKRKADGIRNRQSATTAIPPLAVMGGEGDPTLSEEDDFNASLLVDAKSRSRKGPARK